MIGLGLQLVKSAIPIVSMSHLPDAEAFRDACSLFATGVAVATVAAPDGSPHGLTVSSFVAVSLQPPLISVCIDYGCATLPYFRGNPHFAVNILTEDQRDLSVAFSVKPEGRFDEVAWLLGENGAPVLENVLAVFECRTWQVVEAGDHAIFIATVNTVDSRPGQPLLYFHRNYGTLR